MYKGTEKVDATMFWICGAVASSAPFYFDGITYDEFLVEDSYRNYHHAKLAKQLYPYKIIRKQLEDGDIHSIPNEYKSLLPFPENCTAYANLLKGIKASA